MIFYTKILTDDDIAVTSSTELVSIAAILRLLLPLEVCIIKKNDPKKTVFFL